MYSAWVVLNFLQAYKRGPVDIYINFMLRLFSTECPFEIQYRNRFDCKKTKYLTETISPLTFPSDNVS